MPPRRHRRKADRERTREWRDCRSRPAGGRSVELTPDSVMKIKTEGRSSFCECDPSVRSLRFWFASSLRERRGARRASVYRKETI